MGARCETSGGTGARAHVHRGNFGPGRSRGSVPRVELYVAEIRIGAERVEVSELVAAKKDMTKVVPILSVGTGILSSNPGSHIGGAQVQGPAAAVNKVQAVAQIEGSFLSAVRVRGLISIDSLSPVPGNIHREYGVGVTALVDLQL